MKKLRFIILVVQIILFFQTNLYAANGSTSLVLTAIVLPQVSVSISETSDTRSINPKTGAENLQLFTMKDSGNLESGYQMIVESKNAVTLNSESPFFIDQNINGSYWGYEIYFNDQFLEFTSGQAIAKPVDCYKSSTNGSTIKISAIEKESIRLAKHYSDTIIIKVIAN